MGSRHLSAKKVARWARRLDLPIVAVVGHGGYTHSFVTGEHRHGVFNIKSWEVQWETERCWFYSCQARFPDTPFIPGPPPHPDTPVDWWERFTGPTGLDLCGTCREQWPCPSSRRARPCGPEKCHSTSGECLYRHPELACEWYRRPPPPPPAPKALLEKVNKETAEKAKAALEGAGATVTLK